MEQVRRVLVLYEVGTTYPAVNLFDQGLRAAFEDSPYRIEFYREYLDTILFPDPDDQQRFRDFYIRKYQNRHLDLIVTYGPSPLRFMLETHKRSFSGIPVVFYLANEASSVVHDPDITGVENEMAPAETIEAALRLQPGTKHVVVVGGTSAFDRQQEAMVRERLQVYEGRLDISYLTDLTMPALLDRLKHLPGHTIVLLTAISRDAAGTQFISGTESGPMVAAAANAPVFSLYDVYLNHGELGGDLSSIVGNGKIVGGMAIRILKGEKPQDIHRIRGVTTYMFDWQALKRWGLKEENLPPGSMVLNRQPTVWESYKWYIIGGITLILLEALLSGGLIWQRARRRKAETDLVVALELAQESEKRFSLVANTAPVMIWMSGPDKLCNYFNQHWLDFTGRSLAAELGNGWLEGVHPDDMRTCLENYTRSLDRREPFTIQYRLRQHTGDYRWVMDTGVPRLNPDGSFAGYIGSCIDITECKLAEEALSTVSRRLIDAQEQERTRIARELHDDICQRLAILEVELDLLHQSPPHSRVELRSRLDELRLRLSETGSEVQAISHRLHSSKLEYLGLVTACRSFCREFSEWHKVTVEFTAENIPSSVSYDISLCLFRVLQEALSNAIKHSGAQRFEVLLHGARDQIHLTVRDYGVGFDASVALTSGGLGFISMRERVNLVSGTMLITSKPMAGTQIMVRVPVTTDVSQTTLGAA